MGFGSCCWVGSAHLDTIVGPGSISGSSGMVIWDAASCPATQFHHFLREWLHSVRSNRTVPCSWLSTTICPLPLDASLRDLSQHFPMLDPSSGLEAFAVFLLLGAGAGVHTDGQERK
jgi:hypothetical protein